MIYLHIGYEKTGSTALQDFLWHHQKTLYEQGFYFPSNFGSSHRCLALYASHPSNNLDLRLFFQLSDSEKYSQYLSDFPNLLAEKVKPYIDQGLNIIFTNEHLSSRLKSIEEITTLYNLISQLSPEIKIIVYLRRQDELVTSSYSTAIKCGGTKDLNSYYENFHINLDYYAFLEDWSKVFGKENLIVRSYQQSGLVNQNLMDDFVSILGLTGKIQIQASKSRLNESLDALSLEYLRRFNKHCPQFVDNKPNFFREDIVNILEKKSSGPKLTLSAEITKQITEKFRESNSKVAAEYLSCAGGQLFADTNLKNTSKKNQECIQFTVDDAIDFSFYLWDLVRTNNEQYKEKLSGLIDIKTQELNRKLDQCQGNIPNMADKNKFNRNFDAYQSCISDILNRRNQELHRKLDEYIDKKNHELESNFNIKIDSIISKFHEEIFVLKTSPTFIMGDFIYRVCRKVPGLLWLSKLMIGYKKNKSIQPTS